MNTTVSSSPRGLHKGWRIAGWGALLALLCLPAIAMQFSSKIDWTTGDFVFAAILLGALGLGVEMAFRVGRTRPHRIGLMVASFAGFFTIWSNLAVGIIGDEDALVNLGFMVLVAGALVGSFLVWFRSRPMTWIMAFLAVGQYALGLYASATMPGHGVEWGVLTFFAVLWSAAAVLFDRAAKATF